MSPAATTKASTGSPPSPSTLSPLPAPSTPEPKAVEAPLGAGHVAQSPPRGRAGSEPDLAGAPPSVLADAGFDSLLVTRGSARARGAGASGLQTSGRGNRGRSRPRS